jgi:hypothetical protein
MSLEEIRTEEVGRSCRSDSLFRGIRFGMSKDEFYEHCFEMNQRKLFFPGTEGASVRYMLDEGFESPVVFKFYPQFEYSDSIHVVKGEFAFKAWVPFQKQLSSDVLLRQMMEGIQRWYGGNDFIRKENLMKSASVEYVKIDCNRQITLTRLLAYEDKILVVFEDLRVSIK